MTHHQSTRLRVLVAAAAAATLVTLTMEVATAPARTSVLRATVVTVTAGKPKELSFTLSTRAALPLGTVTFNVTNRGKIAHQFTVCSYPSSGAFGSACTGKGTKTLAPGETATLKVTFTKAGSYEYLSGLDAQALQGMRGLVTIKGATGVTTTAKTTTAPVINPNAATSAGATGDKIAGAVVIKSAGCLECHTLVNLKGGVDQSLNSFHPEPFLHGPLTPKQLRDLAAYIDESNP